MNHVCRINRILELPRGNALLVGVGGSGKQSLSRLAAFISSLEVSQIQLKKGYGIPDLKVCYLETLKLFVINPSFFQQTERTSGIVLKIWHEKCWNHVFNDRCTSS